MSVDDSSRALLERSRVKEIAKTKNLITAKPNDSIEHVLKVRIFLLMYSDIFAKVLADNAITGAPVQDPSTHKFLGFVDVLDLVSCKIAFILLTA
jgi:predicted transcriptional regulator